MIRIQDTCNISKNSLKRILYFFIAHQCYRKKLFTVMLHSASLHILVATDIYGCKKN